MGILKKLFKSKPKYLTAQDARINNEIYWRNNKYKEAIQEKIIEGENLIINHKDTRSCNLEFTDNEWDNILNTVIHHFENQGFTIERSFPYLKISW